MDERQPAIPPVWVGFYWAIKSPALYRRNIQFPCAILSVQLCTKKIYTYHISRCFRYVSMYNLIIQT